ncbi:MAG: hypothetical protein QUS07_07400 [Methanothrix sp.]|nr:hypothetical protein [Methanothrix sp.]
MTTYTSQYPSTHDANHVKATESYGVYFLPYFATDPAKSLTGSSLYNAWVTAGSVTNQRFHIDIDTAQVIRRVYYENYHNSGTEYNRAAKNFTMWGSNSATAFADLVYSHDTDWTQLTIDDSQFDYHIDKDQADPKYIIVTNTTAYRYYAFKISDSWGGGYIGIRRIELQTEDGWSASAVKKFMGVEWASIKKANTVSQASIKKLMGM